jgi:hypothetical protein
MAKTGLNTPIWTFGAAADGEGFGPNKDGISVNYTCKIYIHRLKIDTGDGGDVLIYSRKEAGTGDHARSVILKADSTPANDTLEWPFESYVDGIYIQTLPTNASVVVFTEKPYGHL